MNAFGYVAPVTLEEALSVLEKEGGKAIPLCGGTDLLVKLNDNRLSPCIFVDISRLKETSIIEEKDGLIHIGATVTYTQILGSPLLQSKAPLIVQASKTVGSPQIRNQGTIGGNIGNASPAGDIIPPLYVMGARVTLVRKGTIREMPVEKFFTGPGKTVLKQDELITKVSFPTDHGSLSFFWKVGLRAAQAIAVVSIAVKAKFVSTGRLEQLKIAYGAVAPTVVRSFKAEEILSTKSLNDNTLTEASNQAMKDISPINDIRASAQYRSLLARDLLYFGIRQELERLNYKTK